LYKENNEFYSKNLTTETENLSENLTKDIESNYKPCGEYGDITLNQIGVSLKENLKDIN
jgi:hypothetical protein